MNFLSVENITKSLGLRVLFSNLTFGINQGQKVALVAKNGTGKTSLLKILAGKDSPDTGVVSVRKDIKIAFLDQEPDLPLDKTIFDAVYDAENPLLKTIMSYELALEHPDDAKKLQKAIDQMDALQAWDYEIRIKQILGELKIYDLHQEMGSLSGGQKKRVAMAMALVQNPDLLIMDEPTNHLDFDMIEWLEEYLESEKMTLLMVTHDRYFLDRVCNQIIELENGQIYSYSGNYSYFIEKKAERQATQAASIDKAKNLYTTELEWMRRMPKARGTKSKSRIDSFYDLEKVAKQRLEDKKVQLDIQMNRLGGKILELHHVRKSFGDKKMVDDFSYVFKRNERIGIVGVNGAGKSTFLKLITGELEVDGGKIVTGETVVFGYYNQDGMKLPEDKRVIEVVKDIAEFIPLTKGKSLTAAQLLERFLFSGDQQYTYVSKLSGGERRRLYLCTLLMKNPNFLILDEPTNDLDIMTLQVLEDFLEDFPGCLLIVSHDRYFMDRLTQHLFIFEGDGIITDFNGNYSDYRDYMLIKEAEKSRQKTENKVIEAPKQEILVVSTTAAKTKKMSFKEKQEFEQLEKEIAQLENRKAEITSIFENPSVNPDELQKLSAEMEQVVNSLEEKELRWLELSELAG
ncbi:ABC-F family ATP-binding cassette domain-containing protein [Solitalea canadensis]|uniref:ATPase component of ABC transporters with duplicated ATPase domain n=1 Tax=Solitalea canadensis (strain ATCC 29591 / DSM 3403 / JCM 21819 / LMG 8368 / NBRC 15130 / NCIMB 12057 / USAM 9D) TaxID=929556 RepID=H8KWE9_SOLCM|nr:ABC-F family ATP-binding cassette domain-containing protein [Solitalea canadensis]AFD07941.1 ATPase component of ABC transporters with duplicated ATPase domain [Solitalea canadensis DSM 3403]